MNPIFFVLPHSLDIVAGKSPKLLRPFTSAYEPPIGTRLHNIDNVAGTQFKLVSMARFVGVLHSVPTVTSNTEHCQLSRSKSTTLNSDIIFEQNNQCKTET